MFWARPNIEPKSFVVTILGYQPETPGNMAPQLRTGLHQRGLWACLCGIDGGGSSLLWAVTPLDSRRKQTEEKLKASQKAVVLGDLCLVPASPFLPCFSQ